MYDSTKDTVEHILQVAKFIQFMISELASRAEEHDISKLEDPEKPIFDEFTPKLTGTTYGSDAYKSYLKEMQKALEHHYRNNRHHPEHFREGIRGMTLIDLCEMLADWKAASLRHADGDILKSIEVNQARFGYSDELKQVLINTVREHF